MQKTTKLIFALLTLIFSVWGTDFAQAQQRVIRGKVLDAVTKGALSGVNVQVVGQSQIANTDANGKFTVYGNGSEVVLTISYLGYESQRVNAGLEEIQVALVPASKDLDEVVVVAYGTSKRDNITGSVSTISSKAFENRQVSSLSKGLEGQVPGLQSVAASGQPGTDAAIRIRGIGSVNASSAPLYVVDGTPYIGDINALNPNDVVSVSVLKDASSSALYGSRGANGVIIITTKKGKSGENSAINLSYTQGYSSRAVRDYDHMSTDQYFELYWEALRNKNLTNGLTNEQAANNASATILRDLNINPYGPDFSKPVGTDGKLVAGAKPLWDDKWKDVLQRTGIRSQADLSFSGGGQNSTYYISGGYLNDRGIAIESGFKRYNVRANIEAKAKPWLNTGINIAVSSSLQNFPQSEDSNTANIVNFSRLVPSFYPYYEREPDGSYKLDPLTHERIYDFGLYRPSGATPRNNLAASLPLDKNDIQKENLTGRAFLEAIISKDLKFRTVYSLDYINTNNHYYTNPLYGGGVDGGGSVSKSNSRVVGQTVSNQLTFDKQYGDHHINVLAGQEYYVYGSGSQSGSRSRFVLPYMYEPIAASQLNSFTGSSVDYRLLSFFGRAEYNYAGKYLLSASLRADGSSRFDPNTRWGKFWSFGGSWKLKREDFLKDVDAINQLTVRASFGGQGNDGLGTYYAYQGLYSINNSLGAGGTVTNRLPTPDLKWETNLNFNGGVDVSVLKNRVSLSLEYFIRQSQDLLFTMPMAPSTGYSGFDANIGGIKNTGIDVDIRTIPVLTQNFRWNLDVNFSHFVNKITSLPLAPGKKGIPSGNKFLRVGGSIYDFYIPEWAGVNPENGRPQWYVADADGNKTGAKTSEYKDAGSFITSSALPDLVGGIQNTLTYKNFDFAALLSYSIGGKILDGDYTQIMHNGNIPGRAWSKEMLNRWTPENTNTDVPKLTTDATNWTSTSTRFLYSGTYARLKTVSLGYSLPSTIASRLNISRLRVFATAENLLTFYGHQGMDPEQTLNGATYFRYPAMRTISGGLQLSF
ncbi:SusC/RagA family TonB-linked outer membrane protein [Sphingobacterium sp. Mn56C]|uniref:SusC/RagA family TonB-linked outer membrane protein n=1 Tax=Sphingobacterium sp. Mn56C TaxID=3395261 RepID=UPI003BCD6B84